MSTVWFVLQEPIASLWRGIEAASWEKLCAKLFGFDQTEIDEDHRTDQLLRDPTSYEGVSKCCLNICLNVDRVMYGLFDETKRLVPEPILSHRLAHISLACMRYLHCQDPQNPPMQDDLFAAWVMKSK